jgi:hypothetical protein
MIKVNMFFIVYVHMELPSNTPVFSMPSCHLGWEGIFEMFWLTPFQT